MARKTSGSWAEKRFFDALREKKDSIISLNVDHDCVHWHHENMLQVNAKKFPIRMFVIRLEGVPPSHEIMIALGNTICDNINALDENKDKKTAVLDESNLYWMTVPDDSMNESD